VHGKANNSNKSSRKRERADTVTSSKTAISRPDSIDTARGTISPKLEESRTPTRIEEFDQEVDPEPVPTMTMTMTMTAAATGPNKAPPIATALAPSPAPDVRDTPTPVTPALTPALTGTTDDSDTDFQSAYSASPSPRESLRGNFDEGVAAAAPPSDILPPAEEKKTPVNLKAGLVRERVSSILSAMAQSSPTFSDDTVVSGRGTRR
jgi:hypothetical protein